MTYILHCKFLHKWCIRENLQEEPIFYACRLMSPRRWTGHMHSHPAGITMVLVSQQSLKR